MSKKVFLISKLPSHIRRVPHSSLLTKSSLQAILLLENESQFHLTRQKPK